LRQKRCGKSGRKRKATAVLPPGSDLLTAAGSPAALQGTYGSVVVTSDRPVVAIVNESSYALHGPAGNQDSKNYEGFNIQ